MSKRKDCELITSEDSFSEDMSPEKITSKKSNKKKSKTHKSSEDEISEPLSIMESKPKRRARQENDFEKQLRLAMELSIKEANQQVEPFECKEKNNDSQLSLDSNKNPEKFSSSELVNLDSNVKESLDEKPESFNKEDFVIHKESSKEKSDKKDTSDKKTKSSKVSNTKMDSNDDFIEIVSTKENVKKSKKPKVVADDEDSFSDKAKESSDEECISSKKKGSAKKKTPLKKKKDSTAGSDKKKSSKDDLKDDLEKAVSEKPTITPSKSASKASKTIKNSDSKESLSRETTQNKDFVELQNSPNKENVKPKEIKEPANRKLLNLSDKYHEISNQTIQKIDIPKTETHSLLPKFVSKLPSSIGASSAQSTVGSEHDKSAVNPAFKTVTILNPVKLNQNNPAVSNCTLKTNSPAVRVGLSRNYKFPSLHKNVKPTL